MAQTPILIAGAGPTGLALALSLARRGVPFRLIDAAAGPGEHSRAMVVHARTLELYRQFGIADEVVAQGVKSDVFHLREGGAHGRGHEVAAVSFADMGEGISPYPFALSYAQDDHERFLIGKLKALGVEVERGTRLESFTQDGEGARAEVVHADERRETIEAAYVCGCDGAHSAVRHSLGVGFPGAPYQQLFYVADVRIEGGFRPDLWVNLGEHILALMLPVRLSGMQRLIGLVPPELSQRDDLAFEDLRGAIEPLLDVKVAEVNWFSTYRVHHRVAEHFRVGRAFLLGDAGHIHSPAGGQGMNTGIGDAMNLGWKLAAVVHGRADAAILDSYEAERIGFARTLVATTDRVFTPVVAEGWVGELIRRVVAPLVFSVGSRFALGRHAAFRTVSQVRIHYEDGPLSEGVAGHVHGGDRLPWTGAAGPDNFAPLVSLDWQGHAYGTPEAPVAAACARLGLPLHRFEWSEGAEKAGLERDGFYLVRPDGYVALATTREDAGERLEAYAARHGLKFG